MRERRAFAVIGYGRIPHTVEHAKRGKETAIFTKDMSMMEALQADPRAREVFAAHGMGCVGCMGVSMESIEDGARMHGIDPETVLRRAQQACLRPGTQSEE